MKNKTKQDKTSQLRILRFQAPELEHHNQM